MAYQPLSDSHNFRSVFIWRSFNARDFPVQGKTIPAAITVLAERFEWPSELLQETPRAAEQIEAAEQEELAELDELFDEL